METERETGRRRRRKRREEVEEPEAVHPTPFPFLVVTASTVVFPTEIESGTSLLLSGTNWGGSARGRETGCWSRCR